MFDCIYNRILHWAEDDRLLIDRLCHAALNNSSTMQQCGDTQGVDELVNIQIINGWENGNEQYHRSWIEVKNRLINNVNNEPRDVNSALKLYETILRGYELAFDNENRIQNILLSSKLVKTENEKLKIAKRIYELVFNRDWVQQEIKKISFPFPDYSIPIRIYSGSRNKVNNVAEVIKQVFIYVCCFLRRRFRRIRLNFDNVIRYMILSALVFVFILILLSLIVEPINNIKLQSQGEEIVENFDKSIGKQLDSLLLSIKSGQELQKKLQKKNYSQILEYPAISPIYALQYVLDNIYEKNRFTEHEAPVRSVNFGIEQSKEKQKDQWLASAGEDGSGRLWNLSHISTSKLIHPNNIDQGNIKIITFVPQKNIIATVGDKEPIIKFWDLSGINIESKQEQIYSQGEITSANFSPDGKLLATIGSPENLLKVWQVNYDTTAKLVKLTELKLPSNFNILNINTIAFCQKNNTNEYLLVTLKNASSKVKLGKMSVLDTEIVISDEIEQDTQQKGIKSLNFSTDGSLIVTAAKDGTIKVWNLHLNSKNISLNETIITNETKELIVSISSDGKLIAAAGENGEIQLWRLAPKVEKVDLDVKLNANQGRIYSINFNPSNNSQNKIYLATGGEDEIVKLWEMSKLYQKPFAEFSEKIRDIGLGQISKSDQRQRLVILQEDGKIQVRNLESQTNEDFKYLKDYLGNLITAKNIAISPDKDHFAIVDMNGCVQLWNFSKEPTLELIKKDKNIAKVILSKDEKFVTVSEQNRKAKLRDFGGNLDRPINDSQDEVTSASFSPNGTLIATGNTKGRINLWNLKGESIKKNFIRLNSEVISVKFTPDSNYIVTIGRNHEMILWKLAENFFEKISENENVDLPQAKEVFSKADIKTADISSQDGEFKNLIATADNGKLVKIWDFKGRQLAQFSGSWNQTINISFSPNGKYIVAAGDNGDNDIVERWEIKNLDSLLSEGCDWVKDYEDYEDYSLKLNNKKREKDRLCSSQTL
ncbi:WD40 repeat domain-containing protein [Halotia branconii]|uniref:WD40 repeat-containing protein n=1 Tax=Halotia branconii CENA392 TaxID=1539056 RepID=A0AAJ6PC61_9CYAN|nr:hypothetical protein [Halotia branconii]WGV28556.1 hypothetical protein QI031_14310 [Halotia branconii CENA392]